jgi:hypothetical protein
MGGRLGHAGICFPHLGAKKQMIGAKKHVARLDK